MEQIYYIYDPESFEYIKQVVSEEQPKNSTTATPGEQYVFNGNVVDGAYINFKKPIFDTKNNKWFEGNAQTKTDLTEQTLGTISKQVAVLTKQNAQLQQSLGTLALQLAKGDK